MAALDVALGEFRQNDSALSVPEIRAQSMLNVIRREMAEVLGRELEPRTGSPAPAPAAQRR